MEKHLAWAAPDQFLGIGPRTLFEPQGDCISPSYAPVPTFMAPFPFLKPLPKPLMIFVLT